MIHTGISIHLHKGAEATTGEAGWVSLDSADGGHTFTIFIHNVAAGRSLISALALAVAAEEARLARYVA